MSYSNINNYLAIELNLSNELKMGEFADYALAETIDAENDRWLYKIGGISDIDAFELGIIDYQGFFEHQPMLKPKSMMACRYCGANGLRWAQIAAGSWRLHAGDEVHTCSAYKT